MTPQNRSEHNSMGTVKAYIATTATLGLFFAPFVNFTSRTAQPAEKIIAQRPALFSEILASRYAEYSKSLNFNASNFDFATVFIHRIPREAKIFKGRIIKVPKSIRDIGTEIDFNSESNGVNA